MSKEEDEGLKTFSSPAAGLPFVGNLEVGGTLSFPAFQLFTDEQKVDVTEPVGGDVTKHPITATVTFGPPLDRTLTFTGTTVGEEDTSVIPPAIRNNPVLLLAWAQNNLELAKLAGGRGVVEWEAPQVVDIGGGLSVEAGLEDTFYDEGMNLGGAGQPGLGTGPGNAGTVMGTLKLTGTVAGSGDPIISQVALIGEEVNISFPTVDGFSYRVDGSVNGKDWVPVTGGNFDGDGAKRSFDVPKPAGSTVFLVRVVRTPIN